MKEFASQAKVEVLNPEDLVFKIDGVEYRSLRPTEGQLVLVMAAAAGTYSSESEVLATYINFFVKILDEDSGRRLSIRLMSQDNPLSLPVLMEVMEYVVEEWTARPTKSLSDSTSSPESTGQASTGTAPPPESIPSASAQLVSAT